MKFVVGIGIVLFVLIVLYLLAIMPRMFGRADRKPFLHVLYAHRGLHDNQSDAPENSMKAFRRAVEAGFGIELDVQLTKDKVPVVFHDFTLKRICDVQGKVKDYTFEQLQQFSLCGTEEKIPKLEAFLKMVDGKVPLIIEYKIAGIDVEVCRLADKLLQNYKGLYCIESFNPMGVLWYRKNKKHIMRGQLADSFRREKNSSYPAPLLMFLHHMLFNFLTKPDFIAYHHKYHRDLSRSLCRNLYRSTAVAWTIRSQEELDKRKKDFDMFIFENFVPAQGVQGP